MCFEQINLILFDFNVTSIIVKIDKKYIVDSPAEMAEPIEMAFRWGSSDAAFRCQYCSSLFILNQDRRLYVNKPYRQCRAVVKVVMCSRGD